MVSESLSEKLRDGGYATLARKGWQALIQLGASIALARLLIPEDFGIATAAVAFTAGFQVLGDLGLGAFFIQSQGLGDSEFRQLFTLNLVISCALGCGIFLLGPLASALFGDPRVCDVVRVSAFLAPAAALSAMHEKLLRKRLRFRVVAALAALLTLILSLAEVAMAALGFGYWSLVVPPVSAVALMAPLYWVSSGYGPWPEWPNLRRLAESGALRYGLSATGNSILVFFLNNGDYLVAGRLLGSEALGLYTFSYTKANKFSNLILSSVHDVALPGFSAVRHDLPRLWRTFMKSLIVTTLLTMPVSMYLAGIAPVLIPALFGESWVGAVRPFQALCVFACLNALTSPVDAVAYAVGKPEIVLRVHAWLAPCLVSACVLGAWAGGVLGVAVAVLGVRGLGSCARAALVASTLGRRAPFMARRLLPSLLSSSAAGLVCLVTAVQVLELGVHHGGVWLLSSSAFVASFVLFSRWWDRENMRTFLDTVLSKRAVPKTLVAAARKWIP